jgi:hypothetical protein
MNRGRVGEEKGGKEMDGCPLTVSSSARTSAPPDKHRIHGCKGITQTLIPDTLAVKPKASQSTDGNGRLRGLVLYRTLYLCTLT